MNPTSTESAPGALTVRRGSRALAATTIAALMIGAGLGMAPAASAAPTTGSISGSALVAGEAMGDTQLSLTYTTDEDTSFTFPDFAREGAYSLDDIAPGEYDVYISGSDDTGDYSQYYGSQGVDGVTVPITVTAGENTVVDLDVKYVIGNPSHDEGTGPAISGEGTVGSTLTYIPADWGTEVESTIVWHLSGNGSVPVDIHGAGVTMNVSQYFVDKRVQVTETAHRDGFYDKTADADFGYIYGDPLAAAKPVIVGTAKVGSTLKISAPKWNHDVVTTSYRWFARFGKGRLDEIYPAATKGSWKVTSAYAGAAISVQVAGSKANYDDAILTSASSKAVPYLGAVKFSTPTLSGTFKVGKTVKVKAGSLSPSSATFDYAWLANGKLFSFTEKGSLTLPKSVKGKKITVVVTGSKSGYRMTTKSSGSSSKVR